MSLTTPVQFRGLQAMASCTHMLGVSILSYCLAHRIPPLCNWRQWKYLAWGRVCVILVLLDSWAFVFTSGLLANGVGLTWSHQNCESAIAICISFYGLSKVFIYAFLSEKVYIVWSGGNQISRRSSTAYRICGVVMLGYIAMLVLMVLGREGRIRDDGVCVIGLRAYAGISMIAYDLFLNVFLTAMFLWPLWRSNPMSSKLRENAVRTLYGACVSLITSAVNITIVTALGGNELGWLCLSSCVSDVCINSIALFWVTSSSSSSNANVIRDRYSLPNLDLSALTMAQDTVEARTVDVGRPGQTTQVDGHGVTFTSTQSTLAIQGCTLPIPEDYFDYIPREQRMYGDVEKQEDAQHSDFTMPISPVTLCCNQSCRKEDLEGGPSQPSSPDVLLTRLPHRPRSYSHSPSTSSSSSSSSSSLSQKSSSHSLDDEPQHSLNLESQNNLERTIPILTDSKVVKPEAGEVQEKNICE